MKKPKKLSFAKVLSITSLIHSSFNNETEPSNMQRFSNYSNNNNDNLNNLFKFWEHEEKFKVKH